MEMLTELDSYLFHEGTHYEIYKKLGAHLGQNKNEEGCYFALWAPHAQSVSVIGDFNKWNCKKNLMHRKKGSEIFELFIPGVQKGAIYQYSVLGRDGNRYEKGDPYANQMEKRPAQGSVVTDLSQLKWKDQYWMKLRDSWNCDQEPVSILEVHPGAFYRHPGRTDEGFYNYKELAESLVKYVKKMGYTHIELMGICEYPYDGSWGYQVTGYYAPTSRYGSAEDFAAFVDYMHQHQIGVILDWVPAHFPKDEHGLSWFDGSYLYEYSDPRKGEHPEWGTKIFDYGKKEVVNFLVASALFWTEVFHIDGLRVDAVASMLYLDYGKKPGEWVPNQYGENKNIEAMEFIKHLNSIVKQRSPGVMMIAEESTAWPMVSGPVEQGGLGFTYKWNMGWMHDFLEYMSLDPLFRQYHHGKLTFSMVYNHSERFILVLSHDEVVHLKKSMWGKMPGNDESKLKNLLLAYSYFIGHPGKKLLFMGQDFGQETEWNEDWELDWSVLANPLHQKLQEKFSVLLKLYKKYPALHTHDHDWESFQWVNEKDSNRSILSFLRKSPTKRNNFLFILNFTPEARHDYWVGVPKKKNYTVMFNSLETSECKEGTVLSAEEGECDGFPYHLEIKLSGFETCILKY